MIRGLNLVLSNYCSASCVFCPKDRGQWDHRHMTLSVVEKVVGDAGEFQDTLKTCQVGENGDALLNYLAMDILRIIRRGLPRVHVNLTSNFIKMTPNIAKTLLVERLIDSAQLNVDGHDQRTYEAQKGLSYVRVMNHLRSFVEIRERVWPGFPLSVNVLTLSKYEAAIRKAFSWPPRQLSLMATPKSDFNKVKDSLSWLPRDVQLVDSPVFAWAERDLPITIDPVHYSCPQYPRVEHEAFISPSGWLYPCCLDANQNQRLGNVMEESLGTIWRGELRSEFLRRLRERKYDEIGYPCNRVPFCQVVTK